MPNEVSTSVSESVSGVLDAQQQSHPRRGANHRENAREFVAKWPIGSSLTWKEFTDWAHKLKILVNDPPEELDDNKQTDAWMAHLQRRHQARTNLNKAAQHSDMNEYGGAFSIECVGGALMVKSAATVIAEGATVKRIESLAGTKKQQLEYLFQSVDWSQVMPHEQALAETLRDDIEDWKDQISQRALQLETKFNKLSRRLKQQVATGALLPVNGGIAQIIESVDDYRHPCDCDRRYTPMYMKSQAQDCGFVYCKKCLTEGPKIARHTDGPERTLTWNEVKTQAIKGWNAEHSA